ncbi:cyclic pyranopterin monophosphate synthase MoaC [Candidatus Bipolaricaulota bacterium]|nr:cyclic pyranopterin monophosphate synthase MoaC [Candidatus Bipolaricaulota bacterium]
MPVELTHLDEQGHAKMVDVTAKESTARRAVAAGEVVVRSETLDLIRDRKLPKGDVFAVARVAGIMAAKRTAEWIPLCHPLPLSSVSVNFGVDETRNAICIEAEVKCFGVTGVEMEALTAVCAAGLTIYDMCKAVDRSARIERVRLLRKSGGKSGDVVLEEGHD